MSTLTKVAWIKLWQAVIVAVIGALPGFLGGAYWQQLESKVSPARQPRVLALPEEFEWQWAGENWYGRLALASEGDERAVTMARVFKLQKDYKNDPDGHFVFGDSPVLDLVRGSVRLREDGRLRVSLFVNKLSADQTQYVPHEIKGELDHVACFAGEVEYVNTTTGEHPKGDMVLVNYDSSPRRSHSQLFDPYRTYPRRSTAAAVTPNMGLHPMGGPRPTAAEHRR